MLRIEVMRAKEGMRLALPVQNPRSPSRVLLKVGFELTQEIIDKLKEQNIRSVWVRYPSLAFLEQFVDAQAVKVQSEVVAQIASTFETLQNQSAAKLSYDVYTQALRQMVDYLASHPQAAVFLGDISEACDDLMRHSSSVTYLSLLIGMKLESYMVKERRHVPPARAKEVTKLGLGAMLHDIGITQLSPEVRRRYHTTGDDSDFDWQEHPALGFAMVRGKVDPTAATVVLNHHQRYDGSGYAGADYPVLSQHGIHVFARIAAVADQFDMLRYPHRGAPQPTVAVLHEMLSEPMRSTFDPQVLGALLAVAPPYPPGSIVRLSDGRYAVCIDHHPGDPCRPTVQIIPDPDNLDVDDLPPGETIDLSELPHRLSVAEHEHYNVSDLNFEPPAFVLGGKLARIW